MRPPCPNCGSTRHRAVSATGFQLRASRRCRDCEHEWEPPSPRWLPRFGVAVGLFVFVVGLLLSFPGPLIGADGIDLEFLPVCAAGLTAIAGCWRRLRRPPTAQEAPAEDGPPTGLGPPPPAHGLD